MLPAVQGQRECVWDGDERRRSGEEGRGRRAANIYRGRMRQRRGRRQAGDGRGESTREAQQTAEPEQWTH